MAKIIKWSALVSVALFTLLSALLIMRIWGMLDRDMAWKIVGTVTVLFFLSSLVHVIARDMVKRENRERSE